MCPAKRHLLATCRPTEVESVPCREAPFTTLSSCIPAIMDICLHLQALSRARAVQSSRLLLRELKRRFRKYTDPGDTDHQTIFLVATSFDPRHRLMLSGAQLEFAKQELLKTLKEAAKENNRASSSSENESTCNDNVIQDCEQPPNKHFRHLNQICKINWRKDLENHLLSL